MTFYVVKVWKTTFGGSHQIEDFSLKKRLKKLAPETKCRKCLMWNHEIKST